VGAPRITNAPELDTVLLTPTNDRDLVVNVSEASIIVEDTTLVVIEGLVGSDTARDGTVGVNLIHHGGLTIDGTVLIDLVVEILVWDVASLTWLAVAAPRHGRAADTVIPTSGLIDRACLISDVVVLDPLVDIDRVTTMATVILLLARDDQLWGQVDIWPLTVTEELDSVGEGGGGSVGPA